MQVVGELLAVLGNLGGSGDDRFDVRLGVEARALVSVRCQGMSSTGSTLISLSRLAALRTWRRQTRATLVVRAERIRRSLPSAASTWLERILSRRRWPSAASQRL